MTRSRSTTAAFLAAPLIFGLSATTVQAGGLTVHGGGTRHGVTVHGGGHRIHGPVTALGHSRGPVTYFGRSHGPVTSFGARHGLSDRNRFNLNFTNPGLGHRNKRFRSFHDRDRARFESHHHNGHDSGFEHGFKRGFRKGFRNGLRRSPHSYSDRW